MSSSLRCMVPKSDGLQIREQWSQWGGYGLAKKWKISTWQKCITTTLTVKPELNEFGKWQMLIRASCS